MGPAASRTSNMVTTSTTSGDVQAGWSNQYADTTSCRGWVKASHCGVEQSRSRSTAGRPFWHTLMGKSQWWFSTSSQGEEQLDGKRHQGEHGAEGSQSLIRQIVHPLEEAEENTRADGDQYQKSQQEGAVVYDVIETVRSRVPVSDELTQEEEEEQQSAEDEQCAPGLASACRTRGRRAWPLWRYIEDHTAEEPHDHVNARPPPDHKERVDGRGCGEREFLGYNQCRQPDADSAQYRQIGRAHV